MEAGSSLTPRRSAPVRNKVPSSIHRSLFIGAVAVIGIFSTDAAVAADSRDSAIVTTITEDTIELTVPASAILLRIPKGGLLLAEKTRIGAQASPTYFHLEDLRRGLVVSGWFEPAAAFKGFESFWAGEFAAMKQSGLIPAEPPTSVAVGNWSGAAYEIPMPNGVGKGVNTHIRAELIKAGTWIDLHISVTSDKAVTAARSEALEFLKSIVVNEKH